MKKILMTFVAVLAMAAVGAKAQDTVFSYTYQGQTLYYIIDSTNNAMLVAPMYPDVHADTTRIESWWGYAKPQGAVVIPDSVPFGGSYHAVTSTAPHALKYCDSITALTLPSTLRVIGQQSFQGCTRLPSVVIPGGVVDLGIGSFYHCTGLQSVTLPEGIRDIPWACFSGDSALAAVNLPTGLSVISEDAFRECASLASVNLPESLTAIRNGAFVGCNSLASVSIPGSVGTISDWAFGQCGNLRHVQLGEGVDTIATCAFSDCYKLETINYPSTLQVIDSFAFQLDSMLRTPLILPEGFKMLGTEAFTLNVSLTTAYLPSTLKEVGGWAFWSCTSLADVTLCEGITKIKRAAFDHCMSLHKLILPSTIDTICDYVFNEETQLDTLVFRGSVPPVIGMDVFPDYHTVLIVPCGAAPAYRADSVWGRFQHIVEDCTGIEELDASDGIRIYAEGGRIVVEGAENETVLIYDVAGRSIRNEALPSGIYLVKVGNRQAKKISIE